jgi:hypothetical protein
MKPKIKGTDPDGDRPILVTVWIADLLLFSVLLFLIFNRLGAPPTPASRPVLARIVTSTTTTIPTPAPTSSDVLPSTAAPGGTPSATSASAAGLSPTPQPTGTPPATSAPTITSRPPSTPIPTPPPLPTSEPGAVRSPTSIATDIPPATPTPADTPSPLALPTYTPFPTQTPLPTYTPYPTPTPLPTYTPFPTPTSAVELGREPLTLVLETNADALLGPGGPGKSAEQERVRAQIREGFAEYGLERAGIVLTFGTSPQPAEGNRLAAEVNRLLLEEYPDVFDPAVLRDYHIINGDRSQRGKVEVEVYFLMETQ